MQSGIEAEIQSLVVSNSQLSDENAAMRKELAKLCPHTKADSRHTQKTQPLDSVQADLNFFRAYSAAVGRDDTATTAEISARLHEERDALAAQIEQHRVALGVLSDEIGRFQNILAVYEDRPVKK